MPVVVEANKVEELSSMANEVLDAVLPDIEDHGLWAVEFIKRHGAQIARAAGDEEKAAIWDESLAAGELPSSDETAVAGGGLIARARTRSQHRRSAKERRQAIEDAKRQAVQLSSYMATAEEFKENRDKEEAVGMAPRGVLTASGCFVLVTMSSDMSKDFADYEDVYVGAGFPLATAVYDQLIGDGDPDVYADFKYGRHVQMLLYPCDRDDMELLRASLIVDFQAYDSYNAREIRHSVTQGEDEAPAVSAAEEAWEAAVAAVEEAEQEAAKGRKAPTAAEAAELAEAAPISSAPAAADATMVLGGMKPIQASTLSAAEDGDEAEDGKRGHRRKKDPSANIHLASAAREQIYAQAAATPDATVLLGAVPPAAAAAASPAAEEAQDAGAPAEPQGASEEGSPERDTSGFDVLWSEEPQAEEPEPEAAPEPAPAPVPAPAPAPAQGEVEAEEAPARPRAVDTSGFDVLWSEEPKEEAEAPRIMNVPHVGAAEEELMDEIQEAGGEAADADAAAAPSPSVSASQQFAQVEDPWDEDAFDEDLPEDA